VKRVCGAAALILVLAGASGAQAQRQGYGPRIVEPAGSLSRAPWQESWEYDTGSDNDKRPELKPWQQGGGQQTGGPARNLIPKDSLHIVPR
jgi:hypothetical protein